MTMIENKEWQEVVDAPIGHIVKDWIEDGIRCLIKKGQSSLNVYFGIPKSHPLASLNYDDLPLRVHSDLYFSRGFSAEGWPKDYFWFGWNYRHCDDMSFEMVEKEVKVVACDFKQFAFFAERLLLKHKEFLMEKIIDELFDYLHKQYDYHNKNLEHDAEDYEKGLRQGMLNAYNEIYRKILELQDKENPFTDTDWEFYD